jgi:hypothetical protein
MKVKDRWAVLAVALVIALCSQRGAVERAKGQAGRSILVGIEQTHSIGRVDSDAVGIVEGVQGVPKLRDTLRWWYGPWPGRRHQPAEPSPNEADLVSYRVVGHCGVVR